MSATNKPDWSKAPDWAQWLAMDKQGEWTFHHCEPEPQGCHWLSGDRFIETGRKEDRQNMPYPWWQMLEKRPSDSEGVA